MTDQDANRTGTADTRYTGTVVVGGPPDVRRLDEVEIRKLAVGPLSNNAYVLTCRRSGDRLLVDAAAEPDRLLDLERHAPGDGALTVVVTTHAHRDHVGALADVVARTGAQAAVGVQDAPAVEAATGVRADRNLRHGDVVHVGAVVLEVIALRGHTPGSVALAYREPGTATGPYAVADRVHLFTGDSLFPGGVGNTDRDPVRFARLLDDVVDRVFRRFGDDTWVYPGHGDDTTLGAERPHVDAWRARGW
ncbi:MBL fold metallo-hydrolase [Cellulosimicrobium arenosum]|uniref:MBL fold metallo-hydrolase n=1 Tax=Cellulosimicrobium arenosum TaxID=2708133 RepID=A0A927G6N0_9MICO|nr:MBL fold metallo-hydrolase [Cellulosimicrobium arenosum]MBD8077718.1 MBL fold metallo-hydrolase [Cellulosimicrobium arenosum]